MIIVQHLIVETFDLLIHIDQDDFYNRSSHPAHTPSYALFIYSYSQR